MNNPNRLSTGQILNNRYRIVRLLGQGGFGAVYRAWDVNLSLPCALKENTETSPEAARQFLREAQLLHTLRHPNLPLVKDHFVIPGQGQYLVMDYIEGQDLQEKITAGGITISQAVGWVLQICDALAYMHTQDPAVIHRDIKPANIKITSQGRAVLVDFGIAKVFDASSRTTAGARAVTAGFSPFEQYGSAPTDARTDVYALGATLYALLTGQDPAESIARVAGTELASPRSLNPEISPGLEQVLLKSLAVMPAERYQSIVDFKEALIAQVGEMPELVTPTSPKPKMQPSGGIETLAVQEPAIARRPPSGPPAARPPSTPPPVPDAKAVSARKQLPWKWIAIIGAAVLLLICAPLAYFGGRQLLIALEPTPTTRPTATDRPQTATRTPRPTYPPVIEPGEGDCTRTEVLCVGLVTDTSGIMDGMFNQAAWEGLLRIQSELGAIVNYIETGDIQDFTANITTFAEAGYDVIVTVGYMQADATLQAAYRYPQIYFIAVDQLQYETIHNLAGLVFHEDHAGFLVYGSDIVPPVVAFAEGYASGAAYANPDIRVITTYHPGGLDVAFTDPEWGAAVAVESIAAGADVVFGAGGLTVQGAILEAANHPGVYCLGVDADQWDTLPAAHPCLVSSVIKRVDEGVSDLILQYNQGSAPSGNYYGHVALSPFHDFNPLLTSDLGNFLNDINIGLENGSLGTEYPVGGETDAEPVTITIWSQWGGESLTAIYSVIDTYTANHPSVSIIIQHQDDLLDAVNAAIPSGEGPDIIGWGNDLIGTLAMNGYILDLNSLGVTRRELTNTYEPAAANGVIWQDSIWALPEAQEGIALVYNTALASPDDFPSDPLDFSALLERAASYYDRTGRYLVCNQGLGNVDAYHTAPIWLGFGMPGYVDDQGNAFLDTPAALAAANWMFEFRQVSPPETSHDICKNMLIDGQVAAWWTGPWAIADLEYAGIDYGILPMGRPFVGIKSLMITTNALDRGTYDIALDIIRFFTNAENSTMLALANHTIPANSAALNNPSVQSLESVAGFGASMNLGIPMANTPFAGAQWGPVGDAGVAIWSGALTPAQALSAAQDEMEAAIAAMR